MLGTNHGSGLLRVVSFSAALLPAACQSITEIDVLVARDAALSSLDTGEAALRDACASSCEEAPPTSCVDSSIYPGGGVHKADFADVSDMVLNHAATVIDGGVLRLVGTTGDERGSAYFATPVAFDAETSVYARFAVRIGGGAGEMGTDGMAFVLQSSADGPQAIGIAGGGLGYKLVTPSVAIELDTFFNPASDPDGNHVALLAKGDELTHIASAMPAFKLNDGIVRNVWLDYDAGRKLLEVYMSEGTTRPRDALLSHSGFDVAAALGTEVYIGLSAASGSNKNDHDVLGEAWFVTSNLAKCRR